MQMMKPFTKWDWECNAGAQKFANGDKPLMGFVAFQGGEIQLVADLGGMDAYIFINLPTDPIIKYFNYTAPIPTAAHACLVGDAILNASRKMSQAELEKALVDWGFQQLD